jgi:hypothetical protein
MVPLFNAIVSFIVALAESPPIKFANTTKFRQFFDAKTLAKPLDILSILLCNEQDKTMLFDQLERLGEIIKDYLEKLQTWQVQLIINIKMTIFMGFLYYKGPIWMFPVTKKKNWPNYSNW